MKKTVYLFTFALLALVFTSCNPAYVLDQKSLRIEAKIIELGIGGPLSYSEAFTPLTEKTGDFGTRFAENLIIPHSLAKDCELKISDTSIATVAKDGKLIAKKKGETTLWMRSPEGLVSQAIVRVFPMYKVSYNLSGGSGNTPHEEWVREGHDAHVASARGVVAPNADEEFSTWKLGAKSYKPSSLLSKVLSNLELKASYRLRQYLVNLDGGLAGPKALNGPSTLAAIAGKPLTKPFDPTSQNWTFTGEWKNRETAKIWDFKTDIVKKDMTLVAQWKKNYRIDFIPGVLSTGEKAPLYVASGASFVTPDATGFARVADKNHIGWANYQVSPVKVYSIGEKIDNVTKDMTLTALWGLAMRHINFEANNPDNTIEMKGVSVLEGSTYTLPKAAFTPPAGMQFGYWDIGYDSFEAGVGLLIPSADVTAIAHWVPNEIEVSFDGNGGTGTMAPVMVDSSKPYVLPPISFGAPYHKKPKGWLVDGKFYEVGDAVKLGFKPISIKVAWDYEMVIVTDDTIRELVLDGIKNAGPQGDLNYIDTSRVTRMRKVLAAYSPADKDLATRAPSTDADSLDAATIETLIKGFNGDISKWDVSNVFDMQNMFRGAAAFEGDLSGWDMPALIYMAAAYHGTPLVPANRDGGTGDASGYDKMPPRVKDRYLAYDKTDKQPTSVAELQGYVFASETSSDFVADLNSIDTSKMTTLESLFENRERFVRTINDWDTSSVTSVRRTFKGAKSFNGDIEYWDTDKFENMEETFCYAQSFDAAIGIWNTSNVTTMRGLFDNAKTFRKDISAWDTSKVTDMSRCFKTAFSFDADISKWNTSEVTNMSEMFMQLTNFNQDISAWDVSKVTDMSSMFEVAQRFNQDLSGWNTASVTNMSRMFYTCRLFNQDIAAWDVGKVTNMSKMFKGAHSFNQDISSWNVSSVTNMKSMFQAAATPGSELTTPIFNQDISSWDVSKVTNMSYMFDGAFAFSQNLSSWNVAAVTARSGFTNLSPAYWPTAWRPQF